MLQCFFSLKNVPVSLECEWVECLVFYLGMFAC